ncbi:MAG: helix-turn-helix transcriptional regulator [Rhodobacteraceae bacterium]|nr:helix-turn-helix transcriptional regulator [Paracoccaceae bacterium]
MVHPVDVHVGRKIREARLVRGMTQSGVAKQLGLSFQQLQKYETGYNRVSASKLFELSQLLDVQPSYFFEGLAAGEEPVSATLMDDQTAKAVMALSSIRDEKVKNHLRSMIHEIASCESVAAAS